MPEELYFFHATKIGLKEILVNHFELGLFGSDHLPLDKNFLIFQIDHLPPFRTITWLKLFVLDGFPYMYFVGLPFQLIAILCQDLCPFCVCVSKS